MSFVAKRDSVSPHNDGTFGARIEQPPFRIGCSGPAPSAKAAAMVRAVIRLVVSDPRLSLGDPVLPICSPRTVRRGPLVWVMWG